MRDRRVQAAIDHKEGGRRPRGAAPDPPFTAEKLWRALQRSP